MRINLTIFKLFFIFCVGFFLPWGANFIEVGGYPPLYFIISTILLAGFLFFTGISIPYVFRLFIIFLLIHILITIFIFRGDYLFLQHIQERSVGPNAVYLTSDSNIKLIEKFLFLIFFFVVVSSVIKRRKDWLVLACSFIVGLGTVCVLKLKSSVILFPNIRFSGAYDDPNAFGISVSVAFFVAILLFYSMKNLLLKTLFVVLSVFFFVMLLLSQSRGALIALLCAAFFILKERRIPIHKILIGAAVSLLTLYFLSPLIPERFLMLNAWFEDHGSSRIDIWKIYFSELWKYLFTGVGFSRASEVISTGILKKEYAAHNVFLEMFVEFGLVGISLFCLTLRKLWTGLKCFSIDIYYRSILRAILISWIIGAFFISSYTLRETWLVFALIATAPVLCEGDKNEYGKISL